MSDCDGYSASSGYHLFSEKSDAPVERKTAKSGTFGAIEKNDQVNTVNLSFAFALL